MPSADATLGPGPPRPLKFGFDALEPVIEADVGSAERGTSTVAGAR